MVEENLEDREIRVMSEKLKSRYPRWNRNGRTEIYFSLRESSMV